MLLQTADVQETFIELPDYGTNELLTEFQIESSQKFIEGGQAQLVLTALANLWDKIDLDNPIGLNRSNNAAKLVEIFELKEAIDSLKKQERNAELIELLDMRLGIIKQELKKQQSLERDVLFATPHVLYGLRVKLTGSRCNKPNLFIEDLHELENACPGIFDSWYPGDQELIRIDELIKHTSDWLWQDELVKAVLRFVTSRKIKERFEW